MNSLLFQPALSRQRMSTCAPLPCCCCCRFLFYDLVPMTTLRPLEQTLALNPGVQNLEAFLVANKDKYAELFA